MNTAELRKRALEAEQRLDWDTAREHWMLAVDNYPHSGALAQADKAAMYQRACECNQQARRAYNRSKA